MAILGASTRGEVGEGGPGLERWEECCLLAEARLPEMGLPGRLRILKLHTLYPVAGPASWGHGKKNSTCSGTLCLPGGNAPNLWGEESLGCEDMGILLGPVVAAEGG